MEYSIVVQGSLSDPRHIELDEPVTELRGVVEVILRPARAAAPPPAASAGGDASGAAAPSTKPERMLGSLRGALVVPEDFDDPLPEEILRAFEGEAGG